MLNRNGLSFEERLTLVALGLIQADTNIGLVQQPGWLLNKSRRFGGFFSKIRQIYPFFSGNCSITEVIEQLYYKKPSCIRIRL
jgi:hypothetical protein